MGTTMRDDLTIALVALYEVGLSEGCFPGAKYVLTAAEMERLNILVDEMENRW
jgi:hypothetical protein